jgi:hypothetical protein
VDKPEKDPKTGFFNQKKANIVKIWPFLARIWVK